MPSPAAVPAGALLVAGAPVLTGAWEVPAAEVAGAALESAPAVPEPAGVLTSALPSLPGSIPSPERPPIAAQVIDSIPSASESSSATDAKSAVYLAFDE